MNSEKIMELYPNGRVKEDSKRIFVMNTVGERENNLIYLLCFEMKKIIKN